MKKKINESYALRVQRINKQLLGEASRFIGEEDNGYEEFFRGALKKFGYSSPNDIPDEKNKEFFDYVDKNWDAGENETDVDEADIKEPNKENKPKIIDPSQSDIKKIDEIDIVRNMIREVLLEVRGAASNEDLKAITKLGVGFKGKVKDKNWLIGKATLPNIGDVEVYVELTDDPDKRGIKNSRIIYLWIATIDGHRLAHYGGDATLAHYELSRWRTQPKEPEVKKFVAQIIKALS